MGRCRLKTEPPARRFQGARPGSARVSASGRAVPTVAPPPQPATRPSHTMRSITCSLALAVALAAPLGAQSNAERIANDRYTRSHDYDLLHQRIELRDFDWATTSFTGRVTTTALALRPDPDSLVLDAGELLDIRRVTDARGRSLRSSSHGDTLVVYLVKPVTFR